MENGTPESLSLEGKEQKVFKVILLGEVGVGKTSLLNRIKDNKFVEKTQITMTTDNCCKVIHHNNQRITLSIWDTAGVERFQSLTRSYYRDAHAAILIYDVTRQSTLRHISNWQEDVTRYCPQAIQVLVGNKIDLKSTVEDSQGCKVSACTGAGVDDLLNQLTANLVTKFNKKQEYVKNLTVTLKDSINNDGNSNNDSRKCSC
ncbi:unnamed protein product [Owenia fusiformis]|uniref:Uncharacterized protein n=1 Tax=Owenia fusiformis TaxID=6347 RepID=A0A8J1Y9W0_OWEFU|nr:unnamed protein product [Owenia fusiformis]